MQGVFATRVVYGQINTFYTFNICTYFLQTVTVFYIRNLERKKFKAEKNPYKYLCKLKAFNFVVAENEKKIWRNALWKPFEPNYNLSLLNNYECEKNKAARRSKINK